MIEPNTATPTAPPIWRVVSFTAEPTPAFSRGSDPMMESVQGAMTLAIPNPNSMVTAITWNTLLVGSKVTNSARAKVTISSPNVTMTLLPIFWTQTFDSGAKIMITAACGSNTAPAFTVE